MNRKKVVIKTREDFAKHVLHDEDTGCDIWQGRLNDHGYGLVQYDGKTQKAHRVFLRLCSVPLTRQDVVDHICQVRSCVRYSHIRVVTPAQNALENSRSESARNAKKALCKYGHPFDSTRQMYSKRRGRVVTERTCTKCIRDDNARQYQRRKARKAIYSFDPTDKTLLINILRDA